MSTIFWDVTQCIPERFTDVSEQYTASIALLAACILLVSSSALKMEPSESFYWNAWPYEV
jgi:hypothetical protein